MVGGQQEELCERFLLLTHDSSWLGARYCFAKNTFHRLYLVHKKHVRLETDVNGMALIGNIPTLANQEVLIGLQSSV